MSLFLNKHKNWTKENNIHNWENGCDLCGKPFADDEKFIRLDIEDGDTRGDDEVYCYHKDCYGAGLDKLEAKIPGLREYRIANRKVKHRHYEQDDTSVAERMTCP